MDSFQTTPLLLKPHVVEFGRGRGGSEVLDEAAPLMREKQPSAEMGREDGLSLH